MTQTFGVGSNRDCIWYHTHSPTTTDPPSLMCGQCLELPSCSRSARRGDRHARQRKCPVGFENFTIRTIRLGYLYNNMIGLGRTGGTAGTRGYGCYVLQQICSSAN